MRHREATGGSQSRRMLCDAARLRKFADDLLSAIDFCYEQGWTDDSFKRSIWPGCGAWAPSMGHPGTGMATNAFTDIVICRSVIALETTIHHHMAFSAGGETWYCLP